MCSPCELYTISMRDTFRPYIHSPRELHMCSVLHLECHQIPISNLNLLVLFSTERCKRGMSYNIHHDDPIISASTNPSYLHLRPHYIYIYDPIISTSTTQIDLHLPIILHRPQTFLDADFVPRYKYFLWFVRLTPNSIRLLICTTKTNSRVLYALSSSVQVRHPTTIVALSSSGRVRIISFIYHIPHEKLIRIALSSSGRVRLREAFRAVCGKCRYNGSRRGQFWSTPIMIYMHHRLMSTSKPF